MPEKLESCVASLMDQASMKRKYPNIVERRSHAFAICMAAIKEGGDMKYGYTVALHEEVPERIQALRTGKYKHPVYGDIEITSERLTKFAASVNDKIRGIDLDIDYDHKERDGKAAGWVRTAEVEGDTLWLSVDWTDPAKEAIGKKEYRYFSSEIMDDWTDADGVKHEDVLAGGGLTNRPFLKNLAPLNFSEFYIETRWDEYVENHVPISETQFYRDITADVRKTAAHAGKGDSFPIAICEDVSAAASSLGRAGPNNYDTATIKSNIIRIAKQKGFVQCLPEAWKAREVNVETKTLAEILGIEDEEKILAEVTRLKEVKPGIEAKKLSDILGVEGEEKMFEFIENLKKFRDEQASEDEKSKAFSEQYPEEAKQLKELQDSNKLMETDSRLKDWTVGKNSIPPAIHDQIRNFRMGLGADGAVKFDEIMAEVHKTGLVNLNEEKGGHEDPTEKDAVTKFEELIDQKWDELKKDNKDADYFDAVKLAEETEPDLAKAYKVANR